MAQHAEIEAYVRQFGLPELLPPDIREAYARNGLPVPARRYTTPANTGAITPPDARAGRCCHCGTPVDPGGPQALHAVSGLEATPLRVPVLHCDACRRSVWCDPETPAPGAGIPLGYPGGFCVYALSRDEMAAMALFPFAGTIGRILRLGGALVISGALATLALIHSQGQQLATITGTNGAVAFQDSVAGHGYNLGDVKVYTGSAPGDGNQAETGTMLVDVVLPNPLFGAPSGFPSVAVANAITAATIAATGTAGYARMLAQGDTGAASTTQRRLQFAVGTSGADMIFNTLALVMGGLLTVTSLSYQAAP